MSSITIRINTRTKAGRNLVELARNLAAKYQGIEFLQEEEDEVFAELIEEGMQSKSLTDAESKAFMAKLGKLAGK